MSTTEVMAAVAPAPKKEKSSKRKRSEDVKEEDELEIDINAPEPPSKKAKRKEKKSRKDSSSKKERPVADSGDAVAARTNQPTVAEAEKRNERSDYGVWIGNLSFTTTKDDVRRFLSEQGEIAETQVTRTHMPAPADGKSKNKGFAYVDFASVEVLNKALSLSEKLLGGRKLLIKNAKSFEGRPEKPKGKEEAKTEKEPTKRVFVGNLGFDVTREELAELFGQAGEVQDVFLATFEDSGKCKGFGWVRFGEVEAAQAAVKGFVKVSDKEGEDADSDEEPEVVTEKGTKKKSSKTRKVFINRLNGRPLRCEFAEDAQTRYKKRYGKDKETASSSTSKPFRAPGPAIAEVNNGERKSKPRRKGTADDRREDRRKRHDARTIAPGQSLANAPRASAAIVEGRGKRVSFD